MSKKDILYPNNKKGIYLYEYPMINGVKQYIQVRGADKSNPLILFIHGGPGGAVSGVTHILHEGWEDKYTVVNWDQRNAGNTYVANKGKAEDIAKTGTMEDFVSDVDDIIKYLHTVYEFDKIILMGFSWGSAISLEYAKAHPENVKCVANVGQLFNYREGILCTCHKLLKIIPEGTKDYDRIKMIIKKFPEKPVWNKELMYIMRYFNFIAYKNYGKYMRRTPLLKRLNSPFMNREARKISNRPKAQYLEKSYETMVNYDFRETMSFQVPVYFIFGEDDIVCPSDILSECFDGVEAPVKELHVIEKAGHCCFYDNPESFNKILNSIIYGEYKN